jgi:hypothetical protein
MSRKRLFIVEASVVALIVIAGWIASQPLLRSENSIRAALLKKTPLGSSVTEVRMFVDRRGWLDRKYIGSGGFLKQAPGKPAEVVGATSMCGDLGHYWLPFRTDVTAFWGFDTSNRLVDIWVWKTTDSL